MASLTARQHEILEFLRERLASGIPPTREDIAEHFGFSTRSSAEEHLRALSRKGCIELVPGARGIRLLDQSASLSFQHQLPLIGRISAGTPITAEENVETRVAIDPELFRPRADFLHRVSGHSMKDADILDGDLVGIHAQDSVDNGAIVAAVLPDGRTGDDCITLKRFFRRGSKVVLKPANDAPAYQPIEIDLAAGDEDQDGPRFRIAGIYAGHLRLPR